MKYAVVLISVLIGLFFIIFGCNMAITKDKSNTEISEIDKEHESIFVDEQINQMIESDEFKNATIDIRREMIRELLAQLKKDDLIIYYNFQKNSQMFSFTYSDGTQGGVLLEDHHPYFNG